MGEDAWRLHRLHWLLDLELPATIKTRHVKPWQSCEFQELPTQDLPKSSSVFKAKSMRMGMSQKSGQSTIFPPQQLAETLRPSSPQSDMPYASFTIPVDAPDVLEEFPKNCPGPAISGRQRHHLGSMRASTALFLRFWSCLRRGLLAGLLQSPQAFCQGDQMPDDLIRHHATM